MRIQGLPVALTPQARPQFSNCPPIEKDNRTAEYCWCYRTAGVTVTAAALAALAALFATGTTKEPKPLTPPSQAGLRKL
jgi:hypothetical protein